MTFIKLSTPTKHLINLERVEAIRLKENSISFFIHSARIDEEYNTKEEAEKRFDVLEGIIATPVFTEDETKILESIMIQHINNDILTPELFEKLQEILKKIRR